MADELFNWDPRYDQNGNTVKILEHMEPESFEDIILYGQPVLIAKQVVEGEARFRVVGADAYNNAWTLVYTFRGHRYRPITVWATTSLSEVNKLAAGRPRAPVPPLPEPPELSKGDRHGD